MVGRIGAFAKKNPDRPWITGSGWEYTPFPGGLPTKTYLDAVIKDRPIFLKAYDGHSAWANSKALELAGIKSAQFPGTDVVANLDQFARAFFLEFWTNPSHFPMGRKYQGIFRVTFLIGADGRIRQIWPEVKPEEHAEDILDALDG